MLTLNQYLLLQFSLKKKNIISTSGILFSMLYFSNQDLWCSFKCSTLMILFSRRDFAIYLNHNYLLCCSILRLAIKVNFFKEVNPLVKEN